MSRQSVPASAHETSQPVARLDASEKERELYATLLDEKNARIASLEGDKRELQNDKRVLQDQLVAKDRQIDAAHEEKKLLIASDRDTKTLAKNNQGLLAQFLPSWLGGQKEERREQPEVFGRVINDVPDAAPGDEPRG